MSSQNSDQNRRASALLKGQPGRVAWNALWTRWPWHCGQSLPVNAGDRQGAATLWSHNISYFRAQKLFLSSGRGTFQTLLWKTELHLLIRGSRPGAASCSQRWQLSLSEDRTIPWPNPRACRRSAAQDRVGESLAFGVQGLGCRGTSAGHRHCGGFSKSVLSPPDSSVPPSSPCTTVAAVWPYRRERGTGKGNPMDRQFLPLG